MKCPNCSSTEYEEGDACPDCGFDASEIDIY